MSLSFARLRALPFLVMTIFVAACGDGVGSGPESSSPTGPSSTVLPSGIMSIAGKWGGTSEFQQNGVRIFNIVELTVDQNERFVPGTWRYTDAGSTWRGDFSGALVGTGSETRFNGVVNVMTDTSTGTGHCGGELAISGQSSEKSMRWTADHLVLTPNSICMQNLGGFVWIFNR